MDLVAALACGVRGAESGSALIRRRGTSAPAAYYTTFEADSRVTSGSVVLDQNGGAVIYVNEVVDVVVRDGAGATVRTFTHGHAASAVEVISSSFTGSDYETGQVATSKPTTLSAVMNLVEASFGNTDFNVLVDGEDVTIQNALGGVAGLFFNVKSPEFGAIGDGVANDTAAINAAAVAAGSGGTVRFPAGTYLVTALEAIGGQVWELSPGAVIRVGASASPLITVSGGSATRPFQLLGGELRAVGVHSGAAIYAEGPVTIEDVVIGGQGAGDFTGDGVYCTDGYLVTMRRVEMTLDGTSSFWLTSLTTSHPIAIVEDCDFYNTNTAHSGIGLTMRAGRLIGSLFSDVATAGSISLVKLYKLNGDSVEVTGNTFVCAAGSTSRGVDAADIDAVVAYTVLLAGNTYTNIDSPVYALVTFSGKNLDARSYYLSTSATSVNVNTELYDSVLIDRSGAAGTCDIILTEVPLAGSSVDIVVFNGTGGNVNVGFNRSAGTLRTNVPVTSRQVVASLSGISIRFKSFYTGSGYVLAQVGNYANGI